VYENFHKSIHKRILAIQPAIAEKLPIASLDWTALVPLIGEANRAIARFDGMLAHMPNPMLLGAPLTIREAVLSSRIEGTVATLTEVLLHDAGDDPSQTERRLDIEEIVNYRTALKLAERELRTRPFTLNLLRTLHGTLMNSVRGHNKAPGEFRRVQNYIGRRGFGIEHATFVPPSPDRLMAGLDNWEKYYHSEDRDSLVQLALLHAQFEFLHPFLDGNGRLGRIIIPLFLYDKQILSRPAFYLSEYLEENREEYLEHLAALKHGGTAWTEWCLGQASTPSTNSSASARAVPGPKRYPGSDNLPKNPVLIPLSVVYLVPTFRGGYLAQAYLLRRVRLHLRAVLGCSRTIH
jgi:Fic family protein